MDKNDFVSLLGRYAKTTPAEAAEIVALRSEYPYSQVLHSLAARLSKDHTMERHADQLALAAVHVADRTVLKEIMTLKAPQDLPVLSPLPAYRDPSAATGQADAIDYADEIMRDLERLNTLKHNFELLLVEYSEIGAKPVKPVPPPRTQQTGEKIKSKKQRIIELARNVTTDGTGAGKDVSKKKKKSNPADRLIEEIQATKKEFRIGSDKQKEQLDLIDNFIRTQPSISSPKERPAVPPADLTTIKSGEFSDNIVSETLVEILIKQGKKDKAIEVLKKLIWKYPQKKTYFAAQIEDLKK